MSHPRFHTDPLAHSPLFANCSRKEQARLARSVERVRVAAGTLIVTEGTNPHAVYVIVDGHVTYSRDGVLMADAGPGEHFGDVSALSGEPMAMTAVAGTDVDLVEIGQREFVAAVETIPALARKVLRDLATGVRPVELAA